MPTVSITVSNAFATRLQEARVAYNTENGLSLTATEYAKLLMKQALRLYLLDQRERSTQVAHSDAVDGYSRDQWGAAASDLEALGTALDGDLT